MNIPQYTKLLLHMDEFPIKDYKDRFPITNAGGVTLDTTNKKFGKGSASFTGLTNDYFQLPRSEEFNFGIDNDFTIDFWMKYAGTKSGSLTQYPCIFHANPSYSWSTGSICIVVDTIDWVKGVGIACYTGGSFYATVPDITNNAWRHVAIVRKDKIFYLFVDGKLIKTSNNNFNANFSYNGGALIGRKGTNSTNGQFYGKLDEFRISDIARWTTDFRPPLSQYYSSEFLVKSNSKIYKLANNTWVDTLLTDSLTREDFNTHGMTDLSIISKEQWDQLNDFEILMWTDNNKYEIKTESIKLGIDNNYTGRGTLFKSNLSDVIKINNIEVS